MKKCVRCGEALFYSIFIYPNSQILHVNFLTKKSDLLRFYSIFKYLNIQILRVKFLTTHTKPPAQNRSF